MFTRIPVKSDHIFAVKAEGVLTDADYKEFLPELETCIQQQGSLSVYVDMEHFKGWEPKAAWDDFSFGIAHNADFDKIAVVGDSRWQEWIIKISDIFFSADMRYFPIDQKQNAMNWLQEAEQA